MANSKDGPLGLYSGKIGPLYGYVLYGQQRLRAKRHKSNKPRSEKQKAQQEKLAVLTAAIKYMSPYFRVGFALAAAERRINTNNAAKSYNLNHAIKGIYPGQYVDFSALRLSEGELAVAKNAAAEAVAEGIRFTWENDLADITGNSGDKTMLMAYFPEKKIAIWMISGVMRKNLAEVLEIPDVLQGLEAETYISFVTDDRSGISNSLYTGRILV